MAYDPQADEAAVALGVSRNQLDRAGPRARQAARDGAPISEQVLVAINEFRAWHLPTVRRIQAELSGFFHQEAGIPEEDAPVTSRLKTVGAIVAKLTRLSTSLTRMQDVAGARIVVPTLEFQDDVLRLVRDRLFAGCITNVKDQREEPDQVGYRAIHAIVHRSGRYAEIQIRTMWQDRWAQIVERLDASLGTDLKHGKGPAELREWLHELGDAWRNADLGMPYDVPPLPYDQEGTE